MSTTRSSTSPQRSWAQIFFQTFIAAHPSVESLVERRKAELLAALSLSFSIIVAGGLAVTLKITGFSTLVGVGFLFSVISFISYLRSRSALYYRAPLLFVGAFALLAYTAAITGANPALFLTISFTVLFLLSNLFDLKRMAWFIIINLVAALLVTVFFLPQVKDVDLLNARAGLLTIGLFVLLFAWHRGTLERMRLEDVARAQAELQQSNLELQNAQRVVNTHFSELRLAAEVGRAISQVRDLNGLLKDACELILKEFKLYYVQVYLASANQKSLNLEAGTGEVGAQLVRSAHNLPLDVNSINGRAAMEKHAVVISDTSQSATFRKNPLLPETRAEMAVPLIVADKVVGVLDMQSKEPGVLNEEVLPAFEALAGQLAVAIQNANLLEEANEARAEVEKQARRLVRESWNEYMDAVHTPEQIGFKFDQKEVVPLADSTESRSENAISSSISITGEMLGSLTVEMDDASRKDQAVELVNIVAQQMAQQIENLHLLENAERYRQKAELVVRRTTLEGWGKFMEIRPKGKLAFRYDTREVQPINQGPKDANLTLTIKTREQAIGKVSILGAEEPDSASLGIVDAVVERLGDHIESLRQYDQTQNALTQSEKLFGASSQISQATSLQELVAAVVTTLNIPGMNRALLTTFEYAPSGDIEQLTIIGNWWNGTGHEVTPIGTRYARDVMRVMPMFISPTPVFFDDVFHDKRVDPTTMELVAKRLNLRSVAVLPLFSASQQIGALVLEGEVPHKFTQEEIRLFSSLAPQIATIMENRRQYEETQLARAQSEKLFQASSQLTQVADLQQLVKVVAEIMNIPIVNRVILDLFNYNAAGDLEGMDVAATWWNETGHEPTPLGTHYPIEALRVMKLFLSPTPVLFSDAHTDERFDQAARQVAQNLGVRSGAVLPLHTGSRQVGILFLEAEVPHTFTREETRLFEALAPQIATVLENRRQYERAQKQAKREAMLNAINQKIQSATTVEAVLQIAARELGHALGAPMAVAQLSMKNGNGNGHGNGSS